MSAARVSVSFAHRCATHTGAANETAERNQAAERSFRANPTSVDRQSAIAKVKVYLDSVPAEVALKNNVVEIAPGSAASLVASVDVNVAWSGPADDAGWVPVLQRAAVSADADLAFCPRAEKPAYGWRCYLIKSASPSADLQRK